MEKSLRAAVIGMGGVAPMHTQGLAALGITIAAVCDKDAPRAQQAGLEYDARAFTDYQEMLAAGGFEVLHICLPHFLHAPVAIDALNAGYHVLCEKPIATTVADGEAMLAAAQKNKRVLSVIFQNRFNPGTVLVKEALDAGVLGVIKSGWLRVNWFRDADYYASSDWRGRRATEGGGVLINQSIHTFDLMNYFLGTPLGVNATTANRAHPAIEVEDVAEGVITYANNVSVSFFVNTYHPYDAPVELEIIGEYGRAKITGDEAEIHLTDGTRRTATADNAAQAAFGVKDYWGVSHVKQIAAFYEALTTGVEPAVTAVSALVTQRLIAAIYAT